MKKLKKNKMYLSLAIVCAIGQIVFIFLLNKTGREEALNETKNNLSEIFKNLDVESRKKILLDANLNKEEIILLVNNQTKNSAVEIISATVNEFEITHNDLNKKSRNLEEIKKTTLDINEKISESNYYITPNKFKINLELLISIPYPSSSSDYLPRINNERFKIWLTFLQDGIEMHTYVDSNNKWVYVSKMKGDDINSIPFGISYGNKTLYINNSNLIMFETKSSFGNHFISKKPIKFKLHYSSHENIVLNPTHIQFRIMNSDGVIYKPTKTKFVNSKIPNPAFNNSMPHSPDFKENKLIANGSFKFN